MRRRSCPDVDERQLSIPASDEHAVSIIRAGVGEQNLEPAAARSRARTSPDCAADTSVNMTTSAPAPISQAACRHTLDSLAPLDVAGQHSNEGATSLAVRGIRWVHGDLDPNPLPTGGPGVPPVTRASRGHNMLRSGSGASSTAGAHRPTAVRCRSHPAPPVPDSGSATVERS